MRLHRGATDAEITAAARGWRALFVLGAVIAAITFAGTLLDIVLTMLPGWGPSTIPADVPAWFRQLDGSPALGMRNLDLLNAGLSAIGLPLYLALFGAHRRTAPALAGLALVISVTGAVLFISANAALPMLQLSHQWVSATSESTKVVLESAGAALLARGAHGSLGAFPGFFISEVGTLLMAIAMVKARVFGKWVGWMAVVGTSMLMAYTVAVTFAPSSEALMKGVAAPAGMLMLVWYVAVARSLWRLER